MDTEPTQFQISQMEAILGPDSEPFETFISDHMSSSEENDSEAKSMFNMMKHKDPESLAIKLCNFLNSSQNIDSREKCAVLLSELLNADDNDLCNTWRNLSVSTQSTIKRTLLNRISQLEESKSIIVELRGTVMDLAASLIPDNNWPELLPFLYQCLTSTSNNKLKESAFLIFAQLADDIGETIVLNYVKMFHPLFLNTLNDDTLNDLDVRIAATTAVISFVQCIPSSNEKERLQDLLPGMLKTLTDGLYNSDEEDAANYVLDVFIDLAKKEPKFLRRQLVVVVGSIIEIAEAKSLEEETRHLAIEFMLTLVEARDKVPGMMKKVPRFTDTCFAILLNLLLDIKDEPSWHSAETEHENVGETDSYGFGKKCLDRFSKALGGKTVAPIAIEQLSAYLVAPEWEKRHAALIALASIAKGSSKVMIKYLEQIVNKVLHSFQDPHPRVRWAAINAIYHLLIVFCPDLQDKYHNQVLPALAAAMDGSQNPRLQALAAKAFMYFCKSRKPKTLIPYLDGILNKVFVLLQKDNQMVQEAALIALAATAVLSKEHFQKYYDSVMQYLKSILIDANDKSNHTLQSQALECISIVGLAVGKEKFRDDFKQVMEVLKSLQESQVMDTEPTQFQISQMEAILGPDSEPFETFISDHMWSSEENDSEAKSMFNMMKHKDPESLAIKLCNFLNSSQNIDSRKKCAVLLSKFLTADYNDLCNTWRNLSVSTQSTIKRTLLNRISQLEESKSIIVKLCGIVMDLAASLVPDNNWPELLPFLYQCLTSTSNNKLKESAFFIFSRLADYIGETIVPNYVKMLHPLFLNTLNDHTLNDLDVRIAATAAVIRFVQYIPSSNEKERLQDLLPGMLKTLTDGLYNSDEEDAANFVLYGFIKLAKNEPKFLRRQLVVVVGSIIEIAEAKSLEEETRHLAIEFMLTLVEARDKVPGMMKKVPRFTDTCFAILLNLLLDIKDEPSWHSAETKHENAGERDSYDFGKTCLDRFSKALGGKTVAPIAIEQLSAYLVAPEWEKRHAALIALASIAKGSSKVMIKYLEQIVNMVLHSFQDPHPRVRWAATNAIYRLSTDFCPDLQEQYHNQVLPALVAAMDDSQNPRLQALAAEVFRNFCQSKKPETLIPYLDGILNRVFVLLQKDNQMVQEAALIALAATAVLSKEHFQKYYDSVMQYLKSILVDANDKSNHTLQSKALECISMVGMAVGKEKFRDDFKQVMEMLKSLQESQVKEFVSIVRSVLAYGRICECMGKDLLPYMSTIIPPLVECGQLEPNKTVSSDKLYDRHIVKFGNKIICVKESDLLLGKSVACQMLALYAHKLEDDFYPWISQAASVLVPLLKFDFDNGVRKNASAALSYLLHSAKLAVDKGTARGGNRACLKRFFGDIILAIGDTLYSEHEAEVCATKLSGLNACLKICGPLLNEDQVHSIIDEIKHVIIESSHRKGELTEREKAEDFDAEEAELLREEREQEEKIFSGVAEILITLIKSFKAAFLPFLDELSSYLMPTGKDKTAKERSRCLCIYAILMEHCSEAALKYYNMYLPFLLDACNDDNSEVRQNALYGLGLSAEYGGYAFKPFIGEALSRINVVITHLNALEPENAEAYDNAVSALGKICQFHRETIDSAQIIAWLNCLPIKDDKDEAKVVHDQLCSMVERSDRELWDPNYLHLPKVISVFAEVLCAGEDLATEETAKRMINLLMHFQKTVPAATWESACSLLLPQQEMELESILSPEENVNISTHTMKLLVL